MCWLHAPYVLRLDMPTGPAVDLETGKANPALHLLIFNRAVLQAIFQSNAYLNTGMSGSVGRPLEEPP